MEAGDPSAGAHWNGAGQGWTTVQTSTGGHGWGVVDDGHTSTGARREGDGTDIKDGGAICVEMAWDGWYGRDHDLMTTWSGTMWMDGTARYGAAWPDGAGVDLQGPGEDIEGQATRW